MGPYRSSPLAVVSSAPRASWWRRWGAVLRGVPGRLVARSRLREGRPFCRGCHRYLFGAVYWEMRGLCTCGEWVSVPYVISEEGGVRVRGWQWRPASEVFPEAVRGTGCRSSEVFDAFREVGSHLGGRR